jgi:hypothetical protein
MMGPLLAHTLGQQQDEVRMHQSAALF